MTPNMAWWETYRAIADLALDRQTSHPPPPGTVSGLIIDFRRSPEWTQRHSERTRKQWSSIFDRIRQLWGPLPAQSLRAHHIFRLRDHFSAHPALANNVIRALSSMLSWGVNRGVLECNPCLRRPDLKIAAGTPYEPWSRHDIELFQRVARTDLWHAVALSLYTGQRLGDVLSFRWDCLSDGHIDLRQQKTGKQLSIPIHASLADVLKAIPKAGEFILSSSRGRPWTNSGFGTAWQKQMADPHLGELRRKGLVFHGLRKSAVVMLLEAGCTDAEVAAITGQSREMLVHYALAVNQKCLAGSAIAKWERAERR